MTAPDQSGITDLSLLRQRGRPHMRYYPIVMSGSSARGATAIRLQELPLARNLDSG
jgi:hypothetical protein